MVTEWPAYDVERTSVRVVLRDADERVLLFHTVDPTMPEIGEWWELPGGGVEAGESYAETAAREIAEETGFVARRRRTSAPPTWRRDSTYVRRHIRVLAARGRRRGARAGLPRRSPAPTAARPRSSRSTTPTAGGASRRSRRRRRGSSPTPLASLLREFLGGAEIDEPFDLWN